MRAALYARFSSDLQRDRSIEDQLELARDFASREGHTVTATYSDRARSGASLFGRDGLMQLMDDARAARFDVLIVEALDRLSRDQEDLAGLYKRLSFLGIDIVAVHDGRADQVQVGIRGLVGALYLQDLAQKVRRGMSGVVRDGRHAGGRAYGYRPVPGKPGEMAIVEEEAAIVRRIFTEYVGGRSPREIAARLNAERIAPPRGAHWAGNTINGNTKRGAGILQNELYAGRLIWNRVRMVKDPDTGKRVSRPNPESEWKRSEAPHLRIVPDELWQAAQERKARRGQSHERHTRRPKHLLSGLLKCGACGSGLYVKDHDHGRVRLRCSQAKESGTCGNRRIYYLDTIEKTVLTGLKDKLIDPRAIGLFVKTYNEERKRLSADIRRRYGQLERDLATAERMLERAIDGYMAGILSDDESSRRVAEARETRDRLQAELAQAEAPPNVISLHPATVKRYIADVEHLEVSLKHGMDAGITEAGEALRRLIERVTIAATPAGEPLSIEVEGRLAALVNGDLFPRAAMSGGVVVAEEGLEPPTRGL